MRTLFAFLILLPLAATAQFTGGASSGYALLRFTLPRQITTGTVAGTLCAGGTVNVPYTAEAGFFIPGNTFTAQLSNASGSFVSPVNIGSTTGTTGGSISTVIPVGTTVGLGYRIRVISSNPVTLGANNGANIAINAITVWYVDNDGDGFGTGPAVLDCNQPPGHVANNTDCDDGNVTITAIGQSCNDGDATTVNDVLIAGCDCQGVPAGAFLGGFGSGYSLLRFTLPRQIATGTVAGSLCAGGTVDVPYTAEAGFFNPGNTFIAQLSDASGSFVSPVNIGSITGTTGGSISAVIPVETPVGTGYRIRVISSDPMTVGSNNGTNIAINAITVWYVDSDGDGFGTGPVVLDCIQPPGHVANNTDCDDGNIAITGIGQSCDDGDATTVNDVLTAACTCQGVPAGAFIGGFGSGYSLLRFTLPRRITTGAVAGPLCAGGTVAVPYTVEAGFFNPGNTFIAQLSDASGSFISPVNIGSTSGTTNGSISAVIPAGTTAGAGYRIRVISSDPVALGSDNASNIAIDASSVWYADSDGDGFGDPVNFLITCEEPPGYVATNTDLCPTDANKTAPGACGCGNTDTDADSDGTLDCNDSCPNVPGQVGSPCDDNNASTINDQLNASCTCIGTPDHLRVSARILLEGPYDAATGLMGDGMRVLGLVPTAEPYTGLGYTLIGGGSGTTTAPVLAITGSNAVVDWVVLELRSSANPTTVLASRSALVQRDGDVVDLDGTSPVSFSIANGSYHVAVLHRNHLGCMTAATVALSPTAAVVDFTASATTVFGTNARKTSTGAIPVQMLWAGDVTFNGQVKYTGSGNDRDPILTTVGSTTPNNSVNLYSTRDVNLNGQVKYTGSGNDRDPVLVNVGSTTPNNVRVAQLP